jgi:hypothetical protein
MAGLRAPTVIEKLVPVFTSEELCALQKAGQDRSFGQRRDAAMSICGPGRSRCAARAASHESFGAATRQPGPWTGRCIPAHLFTGMRKCL